MSQYPKFCTSCGSPINPGQKFCTTCGAAITENSSDLSSNLSNSSGPGDTSPMPVVDPRTVSYPDDTQVLNSQDVQNRQYRQPSGDSAPVIPNRNSNSKKPVFIILIVVLAIAVLILAGVLLSNLFAGQQNSSSVSSAPTEESQPSNPSQSTSNNFLCRNYRCRQGALLNALGILFSTRGLRSANFLCCKNIQC